MVQHRTFTLVLSFIVLVDHVGGNVVKVKVRTKKNTMVFRLGRTQLIRLLVIQTQVLLAYFAQQMHPVQVVRL